MAMSPIEPVDCGIDAKRNQLSYDRSAKELASCKDKDFSFEIVPSDEDGKEVGVFEIRKGGDVVRRNVSKKFAAGALAKKKSIDVNKVNCNVTLKNHKDVDLNDIF